MLCGVANILGIYKSATALRTTVEGMHLGNDGPLTYMEFFSRAGGLVYVLAVCKSFWINDKDYIKLVQYLDTTPFLLSISKVILHYIQF